MNGLPVSAYSILIVEDETLLRMMMTEMLEELGHRVAAEAARLEQALRWRNPPISISRFST